jgi:hypothetical protein
MSDMSHEHEPFDDDSGDSGDPYGPNEPFDVGEPPSGLADLLAQDAAQRDARAARIEQLAEQSAEAEAEAAGAAEIMEGLLEAGASDANVGLIWSTLNSLTARGTANAAQLAGLGEMHANLMGLMVQQLAGMEQIRRQLERIINEGDEGEGWKFGPRPSPEDGE